jgi:hypothetical protein
MLMLCIPGSRALIPAPCAPDCSFFFQRNQNNNLWPFVSQWDTSRVTNMREMFNQANGFNQPIGDWDVSSVTAQFPPIDPNFSVPSIPSAPEAQP